MVGRGKWALLGAVVVAVGAAVTVAVVAQEAPGPDKAQGAPAGDKAQKQSAQSAQIDPRADKVLRGMSKYLAGLQAFSASVQSVDEVVLKSGEKLQFPASSEIQVKRPDGLRSDRTGVVKLSLYYDGSRMTLYGHRNNLYASAEAPATLDKAITFARDRLGMEAPGADLLFSDPYEILTEDVISGRYVGMATIDGEPVHHLAFEGNQTDWQIWIDKGKTPLPRRYVITSKHMPSRPQFTVSFSDWNTSPQLRDEVFTFEPPPGAKKIEFEEVWQRAKAELDRMNLEPAQRGGAKK